MKRIITLSSLLGVIFVNAQLEGRVGINTKTPQATLEVAGTPTDISKMDGIIAPKITGDQLHAKTYTADQKGALVYVTTQATHSENEADNKQKGQTRKVKYPELYYYFDGEVWQPLKYHPGAGIAISEDNVISRTGFEEVTEENKTGWRLIGKDPANYGNIGAFAVDASQSIEESETKGATGGYSFAAGKNTTASGEVSVALGDNNTASGEASVAIGRENTASGFRATTIGFKNTALGRNSTVLGTANNALSPENDYILGLQNKTAKNISSLSFILGFNNKIESGRANYILGDENSIDATVYTETGSGDNVVRSIKEPKNDHQATRNTLVGWKNKALRRWAVGAERTNEANRTRVAHYNVGIGVNNTTAAFAGVAIGYENTVEGAHNTVVGYQGRIYEGDDITFAIGGRLGGATSQTDSSYRGGNVLTVAPGPKIAIGLDREAGTEALDVNGNIKVRGENKSITAGDPCTNPGTITYSTDGKFFGCTPEGWKQLHN